MDDEQDMLLAVKLRLEASGYDVHTAVDGLQGLNLARQLKPDLIILDIMLPKMNGYKISRLLKFDDAFKHIPVIMLTGIGERTGIKTSSSDMAGYLGSEPEAYIDKPIEPAILRQTVNRLLKK